MSYERKVFDWDWIMEQNPSIGELMAITNSALIEWTNRSLCAHGYDKETLYLYDAFWGKMLKWAEKERQKEDSKYMPFINMWIYQGKIYRVQGKKWIFRKDRVEPYFRRCGLQYHNMVASWSKTYDFIKFNKIYDGVEYMFIEGDTKDAIGFDVIRFCEQSNMNEDIIFRLKHEQEVIFPISKKYVLETCYTTREKFFEQIKEKEKS